MATDRRTIWAIATAATLLLWPAFWNGYPIVFADTGTYLSQAVHLYAGWDRPVFYSLFMRALHLRLTVWPVVVAQALLTSWIIWLVCRSVMPGASLRLFVFGIGLLAAGTWLPWIVSELMPDVFTPLLILAICLLAWLPDRLSGREQVCLAGAAGFMIASQQSSLPLAFALLTVLGLLAWYRAPRASCGCGAGYVELVWKRRLALIIVPPALAILAVCGMNFAAHGRFAISPFGNVFLLARVIYDGPGLLVLRRACPHAGWRLCAYIDELPPDSDGFLWNSDSPLRQAGGAKAVSAEADGIIAAALSADPFGQARASVRNAWDQLGRFESGDGLSPWPKEVTPWLDQDFPAREVAAYAAARQQANGLSVPWPLSALHEVVAIVGVVACMGLLPVAYQRRAPSLGLLIGVLIALPVGAVITGCLSGPHARYQSRIMWLPMLATLVAAASLRSSSGEIAASRPPPVSDVPGWPEPVTGRGDD